MDLEPLSRVNLRFEPSEKTKYRFLTVRHQKRDVAGTTMPGLFSVHGYPADVGLLVLAVVLEFVGFGAFRLFARTMWVLLGIAVLIDAALAMLAHWRVPKICNAENRAKASSTAKVARRAINNVDEEHASYEQTARKERWRHALCIVPIWLFAAAKAYLLYLAYGRGIDLISGGLMVVYIVTALIHHNVTGYAVAGIRLSWALSDEYDNYTGATTTSPFRFDGPKVTPHEIPGVTRASAMRHRLSPTRLITYGLLTDQDITTLLATQNPQVHSAVAGLCLAVQLEQLTNPPVMQGPAEGVDDDELPALDNRRLLQEHEPTPEPGTVTANIAGNDSGLLTSKTPPRRLT